MWRKPWNMSFYEERARELFGRLEGESCEKMESTR